MRIATILLVLSSFATAEVVLNKVDVTPENATRLGVSVSFWDVSTRHRVEIAYPSTVDDVWLADKAEIHLGRREEVAFFVTTASLNADMSIPIVFFLDEQNGKYDASVIIYYNCVNPDDERCRGFPKLMYYITSVAAYPKIAQQ